LDTIISCIVTQLDNYRHMYTDPQILYDTTLSLDMNIRHRYVMHWYYHYTDTVIHWTWYYFIH